MNNLKKTLVFLPLLLLLLASNSFIYRPVSPTSSTGNSLLDHRYTVVAGEDAFPEFFKLSSQPGAWCENVRKLPVREDFPTYKYYREGEAKSLFRASESYLRDCRQTPLLLTIAVIIFPFDYFW